MLPARADPGYSTWSAPASPDPTVDEEDVIHSVVARGHQRLSEAIHETHLVDDEDIHSVVAARHQHIRALPMLPGTALIGSHRLIHWGSMHANSPMYANGSATEWERPRRMLAFGLADARFEPPLLHADLIRQRASLRGWRPPLGARLALVAHVLVRSHFEASRLLPLRPRTVLLALRLLREHAGSLADEALAWKSSGANEARGGADDALAWHSDGYGPRLQLTLIRLYRLQEAISGNQQACQPKSAGTPVQSASLSAQAAGTPAQSASRWLMYAMAQDAASAYPSFDDASAAAAAAAAAASTSTSASASASASASSAAADDDADSVVLIWRHQIREELTALVLYLRSRRVTISRDLEALLEDNLKDDLSPPPPPAKPPPPAAATLAGPPTAPAGEGTQPAGQLHQPPLEFRQPRGTQLAEQPAELTLQMLAEAVQEMRSQMRELKEENRRLHDDVQHRSPVRGTLVAIRSPSGAI